MSFRDVNNVNKIVQVLIFAHKKIHFSFFEVDYITLG